MRTVVAVEEGVLELNWLWLPSCIGINADFKKRMEKDLSDKLINKPLTDKTLDEANDIVISYICEQYPNVEGLDRLLDSLKYLTVK